MAERPIPGAGAVGSRLDALIRASKTPGIQYVVVKPERIAFEYAGGWADIAARRPMNVATTMMAYSMTKIITAVAVLQLVEAGAVRLDSPADSYLESLPYGSEVTVRQLLAHTSGVPHPIPLSWVHPAERHDAFDERAALAAVLRKHPKLSFPPGTRYRYSNIGYWLLGQIVERVSGEGFSSYVAERVLRPLGITSAEVGFAVPDQRNHAQGYLEKYSFLNLVKGFLIDRALIGEYQANWLHIHDHYLNGAAFGGLVGTARGFGRFLQDQLRPRSRVFSNTTRRLLYTSQHIRSGKAIPVTLGWHIGTLGGTRYYYKEGGGGGFHCLMRLYPASGVGTVVMTNATGFNVAGLLDEADPHFLAAAPPVGTGRSNTPGH